jgi:hypothetical protein
MKTILKLGDIVTLPDDGKEWAVCRIFPPSIMVEGEGAVSFAMVGPGSITCPDEGWCRVELFSDIERLLNV